MPADRQGITELSKVYKVDSVMRMVYLLLLGYITLLPFYYLPAAYLFGIKIPAAKYLPLFLILFLAVASLWKKDTKQDFLREELNKFILIYFFLTLLSGLGTNYYSVSILKAIYYGITGVLVYFIIYFWKINQIFKLYLLRIMVMIALMVSLYGVFVFIIGYDPLFGKLEYSQSHMTDPSIFLRMGRISSTLGNPHFLSAFLSAVFPIAFYFHGCNSEQKKPWFSPGGVILTAIFFAIVLTFSIGAFLSVIFVYACCQIKFKDSNNGFRKQLLGGVVLLCIIMLIMSVNVLLNLAGKCPILGAFLGKIDFDKLANIHGLTYRWDSLRYSIAYLKSHYIFGVGIGRIAAGDNIFSRITMDNYYLLSLVENGPVIFISMLSLFYFIMKTAYKKIKRSVSLREKDLYFFLSMSCASFFINMFFWDVFNHPTMRIFFWSFVGLLN